MKKFLFSLLRFLGFFSLWTVCVSLLGPILPTFENPAITRLIDEFMPFSVLLVITFVFSRLIDKNKYSTVLYTRLLKSVFIGIGTGLLWFFITFLVQYIGGWAVIEFDNFVPLFFVYILALLINTVMQEYLVRGYLFVMLEKRHGKVVAIIFTTALFTLLHGGAFEAGPIAVANVITMSLFVTFLMIYTKGILAPILAHFLWNFLGGMIFDSVSLPYPSIFSVIPVGNILFSGGEYKLENSLITLVINIILAGIFFCLYLKQSKTEKI